ncbi:MAG: hypothetical protein C4317_08440 [Acidimicrobiia bacterium]
MPRRKLTEKEKAAIKKGREETEAVKAYLDSLGTRQGRRVDPKALERKLAKAKQELSAARNSLRRVELTEKVLQLEKAVQEARKSGGDGEDFEKKFIQYAASFAKRKGISYKAFRQMGVPPSVLAKAGIKRTRG